MSRTDRSLRIVRRSTTTLPTDVLDAEPGSQAPLISSDPPNSRFVFDARRRPTSSSSFSRTPQGCQDSPNARFAHTLRPLRTAPIIRPDPSQGRHLLDPEFRSSFPSRQTQNWKKCRVVSSAARPTIISTIGWWASQRSTPSYVFWLIEPRPRALARPVVAINSARDTIAPAGSASVSFRRDHVAILDRGPAPGRVRTLLPKEVERWACWIASGWTAGSRW